MRYKELFEQAPTDQLYFHVTTPRRVKAILQNGIEPGHHRRWNDYRKKKLGERGYVYLMSDFTSAARFAGKLQASGDDEVDILCLRGIDPQSLEADPNPERELLGYPGEWYQSMMTLPSASVVRVIHLTPELVQQVSNGGTANLASLNPVE